MSSRMMHVQRSFREFAHADWLKFDFWIQGPVVADTLHSRTIFDQPESRKKDVSHSI